jgi:type II secretory pathway pseudopilin PulG
MQTQPLQNVSAGAANNAAQQQWEQEQAQAAQQAQQVQQAQQAQHAAWQAQQGPINGYNAGIMTASAGADLTNRMQGHMDPQNRPQFTSWDTYWHGGNNYSTLDPNGPWHVVAPNVPHTPDI